jgi:hypothetical protein
MERHVLEQYRYSCKVPFPVATRCSCVDFRFHWTMIATWMLAVLILLLVAADATPGEESERAVVDSRQGILEAHPEWPPGMGTGALAGIICAGMPADLVRLAWGLPTRTSGRGEPGQPETWYYEGRASAVERLAGRGMSVSGSGEWTVSFVNGRVVAWTD